MMDDILETLHKANEKTENSGFLSDDYQLLAQQACEPKMRAALSKLSEGSPQEKQQFCDIAEAIITGSETIESEDKAIEYYHNIDWLIKILSGLLANGSDAIKVRILEMFQYISSAPLQVKELFQDNIDYLLEYGSKSIRGHIVKTLPNLYFDKFTDSYIDTRKLLKIHEDFLASSDADVRDWATFNIASIIEGEDVRRKQLLIRQLKKEKEDSVAFAEAAIGLARFREASIVPVIRNQLSNPSVGSLWFEAAEESADKSLIKDLESFINNTSATNPKDKRLVRAREALETLAKN